MARPFRTSEMQMRQVCAEYWHSYYASMRELHTRQGRPDHAPLKERNLGTTTSRHITVLEQFWRNQLAKALGVSPSEVGPRRIRFRPHRTKSFDVCWPLTGEPKILISVKSMQNAYRNFTNRIEEAFGDSAVLRLYRVPAVFGFYFFMLDGKVARGLSEQGKHGMGDEAAARGKGIAPHLDLLEEGGDFFKLSHLKEHRKEALKSQQAARRQDAVSLAEQSLLDLVATEPSDEGTIHYDAIAFTPVTVRRLRPRPRTVADWDCRITGVDPHLDFRRFISRLLEVAAFRRFL